jgi:hypothetical protein
VSIERSAEPSDNTAVYPPIYERYRALYPALKPIFDSSASSPGGL